MHDRTHRDKPIMHDDLGVGPAPANALGQQLGGKIVTGADVGREHKDAHVAGLYDAGSYRQRPRRALNLSAARVDP